MNVAHESVCKPLADSSAAIEGVFLRLGDGLGRGLDASEQLNASLAALSDEITVGGTGTATRSLQALSRELVAIAAYLPSDSATLVRLVGSNATVSARLRQLTDSMRVMTILARSVRIEAVVFDDRATGGTGGADFADEITALIRKAATEIDTCAREHAKVSAVLGAAAKAQLALERDYRDKMVALARELNETFAVIQERRGRSSELMGDLAARAGALAQSVGLAIMSLQAGDTIRQRLEHVESGVRDALQADARGEEARLLRVAMWRLQDAQLRDTIACFEVEIERIDRALGTMMTDSRELVVSGKEVFGGRGDGSESFLIEFRARLSLACELIRRCAAARGSVDGTILAFRTMLSGLNGAVSALNAVIGEIVLIGINAGLRAGRLGSAGRSLMVIAQQLKELAAAIAGNAQDLRPIFEGLMETSRQLDRDGGAGTGGSVDLDGEMMSTMLRLDDGGERIGAILKALETRGRAFQGELVRARGEVGATAAMMGVLTGAADALAGGAHGPDLSAGDVEAAFARVDDLVGGRYTMAREREIHAAVTGRDGRPPVVAGGRPADGPPGGGGGGDELAGLLF